MLKLVLHKLKQICRELDERTLYIRAAKRNIEI